MAGAHLVVVALLRRVAPWLRGPVAGRHEDGHPVQCAGPLNASLVDGPHLDWSRRHGEGESFSRNGGASTCRRSVVTPGEA